MHKEIEGDMTLDFWIYGLDHPPYGLVYSYYQLGEPAQDSIALVYHSTTSHRQKEDDEEEIRRPSCSIRSKKGSHESYQKMLETPDLTIHLKRERVRAWIASPFDPPPPPKPELVRFEKFELTLDNTNFLCTGDYFGYPYFESLFQLWSTDADLEVGIFDLNVEEAFEVLHAIRMLKEVNEKGVMRSLGPPKDLNQILEIEYERKRKEEAAAILLAKQQGEERFQEALALVDFRVYGLPQLHKDLEYAYYRFPEPSGSIELGYHSTTFFQRVYEIAGQESFLASCIKIPFRIISSKGDEECYQKLLVPPDGLGEKEHSLPCPSHHGRKPAIFEKLELEIDGTCFVCFGRHYGYPCFRSIFSLYSTYARINVDLCGPDIDEALEILQALRVLNRKQVDYQGKC
jgi:hypothetical protein